MRWSAPAARSLFVLLLAMPHPGAAAEPSAWREHLARGHGHAQRQEAAAAEREIMRAVELAREDEANPWAPALALHSLAGLYSVYPELPEAGQAEPLLLQSLEAWESWAGPEATALVPVLRDLATLQEQSGARDDAEATRRRALEILQLHLPPDHSALRRWPAPDDELDQQLIQSTIHAGRRVEPCEAPGELPEIDAEGTYLRPSTRDGRYIHVTPRDMPWVVAIGLPKRAPLYGSRKEAREVAIRAIRGWEEAIQPHLPWFQIEFVEEDPDAAVQVKWKRKITGPYAGFGGQRWRRDEQGCLHVGGAMEVSTQPSNFIRLELDEVELLFAHEFGHVLGLGHCHECESAMNYDWQTRDRVFVTELDVRTFLKLVSIPNGASGVVREAPDERAAR